MSQIHGRHGRGRLQLDRAARRQIPATQDKRWRHTADIAMPDRGGHSVGPFHQSRTGRGVRKDGAVSDSEL